MSEYNPKKIEAEVQEYWQTEESFKAIDNSEKPKYYCLSMFPYPSGKLHMGHVRNYMLGDVIARYQRMLGKNVMQPFGWDAFGLPAENAAIKHGESPATWTYSNIAEMKKQLQQLGFGFDWSREFATCDPHYYHWEQWFFTKLYAKGLAYKKMAMVNWDPVDQTVLANEQVENGRGWRSGALVERREISQWFIKITAYAEELLKDLDQLSGWPEQVVTMQRNWIGKSFGAEIDFYLNRQWWEQAKQADAAVLNDPTKKITVFTTCANTLFGVTYLAVAYNHPIVATALELKPVLKDFIQQCKQGEMAEAALATLEKQGVDSGLTAIHPLTGQEIPIWIANFVLLEYGTGAVMCVPAHDQRDFEFAKIYHLPMKQVVKAVAALEEPDLDFSTMQPQKAFLEKGILCHSNKYNNLDYAQACAAIVTTLAENHLGREKIQYRLRDWGVSRQRYWGAPIPIIYCDQCGTLPVPDDQLPVILPNKVDLKQPGSPLKKDPEFYQTPCPKCEKPATRETDTFDTFMESSWYFARFACSNQNKAMIDERANYWLPVDQYVGGIEHAILHLLYARFYCKLLRDAGLVTISEPFSKLLSQGMVLKDGSKMSKSKGNTVDPQALIDQYGADTIRLFSMFAAPPEQSLEYSDAGVEGAHRFLKKLWHFITQLKMENLITTSSSELTVAQQKLRQSIHMTLQQINFDYSRNQFNTVVSGAMKIFNGLYDYQQSYPKNIVDFVLVEGVKILLLVLNPIVPHITQYLWLQLWSEDILQAVWPSVDPNALISNQLEYVVQFNGKVRGKILVNVDADQEILLKLIQVNPQLSKYFPKNIVKVILVPKKLINIVGS